VSISGFDGSQAWTSGTGYLPISVNLDGNEHNIDVQDVDFMPEVTQPILSLGKLLRAGYSFHFSDKGADCYSVSPCGSYKIPVVLGIDDLLHLPHFVRDGSDKEALPSPPAAMHSANIVRRTVSAVTSNYLHDLFVRASEEKVYQTMRMTHGYTAIRLPPHECSSCAEGNARARGLSHSKHHCKLIVADFSVSPPPDHTCEMHDYTVLVSADNDLTAEDYEDYEDEDAPDAVDSILLISSRPLLQDASWEASMFQGLIWKSCAPMRLCLWTTKATRAPSVVLIRLRFCWCV